MSKNINELNSNERYKKENTIVKTIRLNKNTDSDLIEFLQDKNFGAIVKQALRYYMEQGKGWASRNYDIC